MKRYIAKAVSLMAFVCLLTAAGYSQTLLTVNVPFEFNVGQKTFPAGAYQVVQVTREVLALRDSDNQQVATAITSPVLSINGGVTPKLRFEMKDGRPVLSEVWADEAEGHQLRVPKRLTALAQNPPAPVQTTTASYVGK